MKHSSSDLLLYSDFISFHSPLPFFYALSILVLLLFFKHKTNISHLWPFAPVILSTWNSLFSNIHMAHLFSVQMSPPHRDCSICNSFICCDFTLLYFLSQPVILQGIISSMHLFIGRIICLPFKNASSIRTRKLPVLLSHQVLSILPLKYIFNLPSLYSHYLCLYSAAET